MKIIDDFYPSSDSIHSIHARWHIPNQPTAVLRICHGMCEYIDRYDDFAEFMAENGFVVCGNDHLGHGKSVGNDKLYGWFAEKQGVQYLLEDTKKFGEIAAERYPDLPQFLLGHSMGSLIVRQYLAEYDEPLTASVLCGTLGPLPVPGAAHAAARLISAFQGNKKESDLLYRLAFGGYFKRIPQPKTIYDWVCTDESVVSKYSADPLCTYRFTNAAMCDLIKLYGMVSRRSWVKNLPKDLPIFLIAGSEDPCGSYGSGVEKIHHRIQNAGVKTAQIKIYPDVRHEILNDVSKAEVYADILAFFRNYLTSEE